MKDFNKLGDKLWLHTVLHANRLTRIAKSDHAAVLSSLVPTNAEIAVRHRVLQPAPGVIAQIRIIALHIVRGP